MLRKFYDEEMTDIIIIGQSALVTTMYHSGDLRQSVTKESTQKKRKQ